MALMPLRHAPQTAKRTVRLICGLVLLAALVIIHVWFYDTKVGLP